MKIGDGTGPPGFPSYTAVKLPDGTTGVKCTFRNCGHQGTIGPPALLSCGDNCRCPCCRCLQGETVHGLRIGS